MYLVLTAYYKIYIMISNDFKLTLRHLWRRRIYSVVILLSLSIGFTCTDLLTSFLISEMSVDNFHVNLDRTYQMFSNDPFGDNGTIPYIHHSVGNYLKDNYPEVKKTCRVYNIEKATFETGAGEFSDIELLSSDSTFFTIFSFELSHGSAKRALSGDGIVLTEEKASVLFGDVDPVGKEVILKTSDTTKIVTVTGVLTKDMNRSHLQFDALIQTSPAMPGWGAGATYVLLADKSQAQPLQQKLNADPQRPGLLEKMNYSFKPLASAYFNPDNKMPYGKIRSMVFIWVCAGVCGLIFLMASFNFINLFLLSIQGRQKESGIKKTLGASLNNLISSSTIEVLIYVTAAFLLSILFTFYLLSSFNNVLGASLTFGYLFRADVMFAVVLSIFLLGLAVVVIAAWRQWKTKSVSLMKNVTSTVSFNKGFFLLQFAVSATLIICATTIIRQMDFVENEPLGFNKNIIQVQAPSKETTPALQVLKQKLSQIPTVGSITLSNGNPVSGNMIVRYELEKDKFYTPYLFSGDEDLIKTLGLTLLKGSFASPPNPGKVVNEAFVRQFNFQNPIGEKIPGTKDEVIIGVVKDFTCGSFKEKIPPVIISFDPQPRGMLIGYHQEQVSALLSILEREWKNVFPDQTFTYRVIQQDLMSKYKNEKFLYGVVVLSSVISIVISGFGLFALSWAVVQSRVKEIGIRKVLGATASDIFGLLTISFMKRIVLAFSISIPLGFYLMSKWLENFETKIVLGASIFVYSGVIVLVIALLTLSLQTAKAALLNPVDELKSE